MGKNKSSKKVKVISDLGFVPDGLSDKKMRKQIKKIEKQNKKAEKKKQESFFAFKFNVNKGDIEICKSVDQFFVENDTISIYDATPNIEELHRQLPTNEDVMWLYNGCDEYTFVSKNHNILISIMPIVSNMFVCGYNDGLDHFNNLPYKKVVENDIILHDENSGSCYTCGSDDDCDCNDDRILNK